MSDRLPIIVLAGSDSRPATAPQGMPPQKVLCGPKGTIPLQTGRCLAAELVTQIRASGCFAEPLLIGPRDWYQGRVDCPIEHVEGPLIQTLRQLADTVQTRFDPEQPFAVTTCDILPSAADLQQLIAQCYAPHADTMFWWQMIAAKPDDMGASAWKPSYRIAVTAGEPLSTLYPGHLVVTRSQALRFRLMNRLLELAYRSRNKVLERRYLGITFGALGTVATHDLANLARLQLPVLTCSIPFYGLRGYYRYRRGTATINDMEVFLKRAFLHRKYHGAAHGRPVVISPTSLLAFAKDVDTKEELEELQR